MKIEGIKQQIYKNWVPLCLILIILLSIVLRFWSITSLGLWPPDAGNYVRMSTWLIGEGGIPMDWEPPMTSVLISASFLIFGLYDYVAISVIALFSVLSIILIYLICKELLNKKIGLVAALFLAIMEYHIVFSRLAMADNILTFFYMLSLFFFIKAFKNRDLKYYFLFGISASFSFLTKYVGFQILVIVLIFLFYHKFANKKFPKSDIIFNIKGILIAILLIVISQLCWTFFLGIGSYMSPEHHMHFSMSDINFGFFLANGFDVFKAGIEEYIFLLQHYANTTNLGSADLLFFLNPLLIWVSPIILFFFLIGCFLQLGRKKDKLEFILLVYFLFIFLFFIFLGFKAIRVIVPVLPILCALAAIGFNVIKSKKIFGILLTVIIVSSVLSSINSIQSYHNGYRQAGLFLKENLKKEDLVFYSGTPQLLFYHEVDTGNWWDYGDVKSLDNITYVILVAPKKYGNVSKKYIQTEKFEEAFTPIVTYYNDDPLMEVYGEVWGREESSEYGLIIIYKVNESARKYFNY